LKPTLFLALTPPTSARYQQILHLRELQRLGKGVAVLTLLLYSSLLLLLLLGGVQRLVASLVAEGGLED
jgi:uncharacterized membrane protein